MTVVRTRNGSFKILATLGAVLFMAFFSACDILATDGARSAIAGGREIREFEDATLRPIEEEMNDLWVVEIEPRERALEDLRHDLQILDEDLLGPMRATQSDPWAPGGEAQVVQETFDALNREYELMQRAIEIDQRELDAQWQVLWSSNSVDPEYQALEDLRFETQRELDRLYRFGNRPIDDIWGQINDLNASQGFSNTDSQIESEQINIELRRLWDLLDEVNNSSSDEVNALYDKAGKLQNDLNDLYNFGSNPINEIYAEIERLEADRNPAGSGSSDSIITEIADLEDVKASYILERDNDLEAWYATLSELKTTTSTSTTSASADRIGVLQNLIADLDNQIAGQLETLNAENDLLAQNIVDHKATYNQVIKDDTAFFQISSTDRLAAADALQTQIDELTAGDAVANADQIASLTTQKATLIAEEAADAAALHAANVVLEAERDAGVADYEASIDSIQAAIHEIPSAETAAAKTGYEDELESLLADLTAVDIQASIKATETHWNNRIDEIVIKIAALQNELVVGSSDDDSLDSRTNSLRLQAAEMDKELNEKISNIEALVNELYDQANNYNSSGSGQGIEIQRQIDDLNDNLENIWASSSKDGLQILVQVQALQKRVRVLEDEREAEQYRLEEEIWDLDDKLSRSYKNQNSGTQSKEAEYQAIAEALNQRRFELDELRWTAGIEQQDALDAINAKQMETNQEINLIEQTQFGTIKTQMRELEDALQVFYNQQRDLENVLRDAQRLVEQKKRELEDKVFDALENAAGTVDQAGETILTATEEIGSETLTIPDGATSTDGTAN